MSRKRGRDEDNSDADGELNGSGLGFKAEVTESNGEISCSIEETNRIRALLGLRPLDEGKPDKQKQAVENFRAQREAEQKAKETKEIADRLAKAKEKRLLSTKLAGPTLGDVDNEDADQFLSAADWVKRSRKVELTEKEKSLALARKRELEEEEMLREHQQNKASYNASDLQGLSIMHSADDLSTGQEIILTLADSSVLEKDDRGRAKGLHFADDVLENVNLADASRKAERDKVIKKAKQPAYTGYDDAEFEEGALGSRPSILPQYDKEKKKGPQLVLGTGGIVSVAAQGDMGEKMDMDDPPGSTRALPQSLMVSVQDSGDYYSKAEYSSFNKPKRDKEKKKRKLRKKEEDLVEMEVHDEDDLETLLMKSGAVSADGVDRGTRDHAAGAGKGAESDKRRDAYNIAVQRAEAKTRTALGTSSEAVIKTSAISGSAFEAADDDADIALSLARARRLALQQQRSKDGNLQDAGAAAVAQQVEAQRAAAAQSANESKDNAENAIDANNVSVDGRKADGTVVFSETTEFTVRLQAQLSETARGRAEAAIQAIERKQVTVFESRQRVADEHPERQQMVGGCLDENGMDIEAPDMDEDGELVENGQNQNQNSAFIRPDEAFTGTSMAATLALLKATGELKAVDKLAGRAKDVRQIDPSSRDFDVKLEYRDETGRKLTQKEAFRQINYQFHGIAPGKKKQEKRLQQLALEERSGSSRAVTGEGGTMLSLVKAQQAMGSAFISVQGGSTADYHTSIAESALTPAQLAAQMYANQQKRAKEKERAAKGSKGGDKK